MSLSLTIVSISLLFGIEYSNKNGLQVTCNSGLFLYQTMFILFGTMLLFDFVCGIPSIVLLCHHIATICGMLAYIELQKEIHKNGALSATILTAIFGGFCNFIFRIFNIIYMFADTAIWKYYIHLMGLIVHLIDELIVYIGLGFGTMIFFWNEMQNIKYMLFAILIVINLVEVYYIVLRIKITRAKKADWLSQNVTSNLG